MSEPDGCVCACVCVVVTGACDGVRSDSAERSRATHQCRSPWRTCKARSAASPSRSSRCCCCGAGRRSTPPKATWTTSSGTTGASGASTTTASFTPSERSTTRAPRLARAHAPWTVRCASGPDVPASIPGARGSNIRRAAPYVRPWPGCACTGARRIGFWRSSGWENFSSHHARFYAQVTLSAQLRCALTMGVRP